MGREHKDQRQLVNELAATFGKIQVGATYAHYKDPTHIYTVTSLAFLEASDELCVIYRADYDQHITFVRPLSQWLNTVQWRGTIVPRFRLVTT